MALTICPACGYPTIDAVICAACSLAPAAPAEWRVVYEDAPASAA